MPQTHFRGQSKSRYASQTLRRGFRGELRSLFEVCAAEANNPRMRARGVRDAAMLALLYVGGLRRTELSSLRLSDYDTEAKTVRIRGKGNKER